MEDQSHENKSSIKPNSFRYQPRKELDTSETELKAIIHFRMTLGFIWKKGKLFLQYGKILAFLSSGGLFSLDTGAYTDHKEFGNNTWDADQNHKKPITL